jgi:hypothetical protein
MQLVIDPDQSRFLARIRFETHTLIPAAMVHDVWLKTAHARSDTPRGTIFVSRCSILVCRHVLNVPTADMRQFLFVLPFLFGMMLSARADGPLPPVSLSGSNESMLRQNRVARDLNLPFLHTRADVSRKLGSGVLVALPGNSDYDVTASHPFARPEVRTFVERLAADYRRATGERLVVTSLVRPVNRQPPNAHPLSVHPAGIAIDLRISSRRASRQWLEQTLLEMERAGVLDVTFERNPPHYHVALFPDSYLAWLNEPSESKRPPSVVPGTSSRSRAAESVRVPSSVNSAAESARSPSPIAEDTREAIDRLRGHVPLLALLPIVGTIFALLRVKRHLPDRRARIPSPMAYVDMQGRIVDRRTVRW